MNVAVENDVIPENRANQLHKKILVVSKDFASGQTIYTVCFSLSHNQIRLHLD
jgi:hypothetical protein